jgi:predicted transcriptional regulator
MPPLPERSPKQLSLGPLETEILELIWALDSASVKEIHDRILTDPDRELAYASVTTVLQRLTQKGWLACDRQDRSFRWRPLISKDEAQALQAHDQLQRFLAIGNPDVVAAFADQLDGASVEKIEAIAQRLKSIRQARQAEEEA